MAEKVIMPKLGATMEEGIIDEWLVEVGEEVEEGDPIVAIQTDKITIEVESETTGVLLKKLYDKGETVPVQKVIAFIGEEVEDVDELVDDDSPAAQQEPKQKKAAEEALLEQSPGNAADGTRRTPIARRLASENNIFLEDIQGTGPLGRIQKADVVQYLTEQPTNKITPLAKKMADGKGIDTADVTGSGARGKIVKDDIIAKSIASKESNEEDKRVPYKGIRKVIAERISDSFYSAPHVTLFSDVNMTDIVALRKKLLPIIEEVEDVRVSFNDILIKATACALKKNPNMNVSLENEKEIVFHSDINIGFAAAVPDGLVVPVLRDVDQKGLAAIAKEAKSITRQAREGSLLPEDMQGSTFTISNLGMYAVDGFTPIINQPNAAILGVGRILEKPVVLDGEVKVQSMMALSLSFDHRIIDGTPAAQFLTDLKNVLEKPFQLLI